MSTDPYLTLPLGGLRLIEASAGTGKTFTLATLFTRLVIEQGLELPHILTVTYTEAATQELRARIRERLALAANILTCQACEDDHVERALTRHIIERHLAHGTESAPQLAVRLCRAVEDIDLASIFTIHGFCARVLREYALESGQPLIARELIANPRDLYTELASDLWRSNSHQQEHSNTLAGLWKDEQALAHDLAILSSDLLLRPAIPTELMPNPHFILDAATRRLTQAIIEHEQHARQLIADAFEQKTFNGSRARRSSFDKAFMELQAGRVLGEWPRGKDRHIDKLSSARLPHFCQDGGSPPSSPLFDALTLWFDADDLTRQWVDQQKISLLHRIRDDVRQRLAVLKQQRKIQTFDDLIQHLTHALQGEHAERLCQRLRTHYRFALVDEFQDTDPRQWEIFRRIFSAGLFLIGDPKQAIYGFRGGDIQTYLEARSRAIPAPPLAHNFRSRPGVLRAIDALYQNAGASAFGDTGIAFVPIHSGGHCRDEDYLLDHSPAPALTICQMQSSSNKVGPVRAAITSACATDIHRVLSAARVGRAMIKGAPVKPGDIAVLVRNHKEASLIRKALGQLGIPAVSAGKQSLYATDEALDIRLLLLALLQPSDQGRLRAALSTVLLGIDAAAIAALEQDPGHRHHDEFMQWRQLYQRSGIFAMLSAICAAHATRLLRLSDGERRLTNSLQLAECLQEASRQHPSLNALLDWLETRIAHADDSDEAQQLRLESDARCVQIVTLHKSKGLEYPLVYLPFVGLESTSNARGDYRVVHEDHARILYWKIDKEADEWGDVVHTAAQEERNESARLLYVGLTRAKHALWLAEGNWMDNSSLAPMLQDRAPLAAHPDIILTGASTDAASPPRLLPEPASALPPPRRARRRLHADWWVYSFTQLAHTEGQFDPNGVGGGAEDEITLGVFAGSAS